MSSHTKRNNPVRIIAIIIAAVAAFIASSAWYIALGTVMVKLRGADAAADCQTSPPAWLMLAELGRSVVLAIVLERLAATLNTSHLRQAALLGVQLWIGFPAVILVGSVMWENVPPLLAAIHAGDWLIKLMLITSIVGAGRPSADSGGTASSAMA